MGRLRNTAETTRGMTLFTMPENELCISITISAVLQGPVANFYVQQHTVHMYSYILKGVLNYGTTLSAVDNFHWG